MTAPTNKLDGAMMTDERIDAAITACALMIKGICLTKPRDEWTTHIEARIRFMLKGDVAPSMPAAPMGSLSENECEPDVYEHGQSVGYFDIPKETANAICAGINSITGARVDWHYIAGRVHMKALAASPAEPAQSPALIGWWNSDEASGFRWKEGIVRGDFSDGTPIYANTAAPAQSMSTRESARKMLLESYRGKNVGVKRTALQCAARGCEGCELCGAPAQSGEPVAWVRYRSDGGFEGPIMDSDARMCDTRRGFWTPLYATPQPSQPAQSGEALTEEAREAYQGFLDDTKDVTRPYARHALVACIAECHALSYSEDRGITVSEAESIGGVLHELRRLQNLEAEAVEVVTRESAVVLDDERSAFESAWSNVYDTGNFLLRHHTLTEHYANHDTQRAWEGWKLARAASPQAKATQPAQTYPECQACGDGITAHDPGVCGNCFAMKYRDAQTARTLTKEIIGAAWRECGARSNSPPDWALQFAQNIARALLAAPPSDRG